MNSLSISSNSSTGAKTSTPSSSSSPLRTNTWLQLLNKLSYLVSIIGILWYCILLSKGKLLLWGMPLFIAATVCKLLSNSPRYYYNTNDSNSNSNKRSKNRHKKNKGIQYDDWSSGKSSRARRMIVPMTCYHRTKNDIQQNTFLKKLVSIYKWTWRTLTNDNHYNVLFLSTFIVIVPCAIYFANKIQSHLTDFREAGEGINHKKLANDFGKLGSAGLTFLLIPVSKFSPLISALKLSEVHMIRMHICAGCVVLFGGITHGLYYTFIWIKLNGDGYADVFPLGNCWHGGYDKSCYSKFVNLLGITCGISFVVLGVSSLYWVRRKFYRLFYYLHVVISVIVLFALVMHYNKAIYFIAPSFLYYTASNLPVHVESLIKWWRQRRDGGIQVSKVVCIPDSGGCVELSLRMNNAVQAVGALDDDRDDGIIPTHHGVLNEFQSFHDTIGKYIQLHVPEISLQSHPFTIFTHPNNNENNIQILFRPCGSFTTTLSKRLKALTLLPEPTPSEIENHQHTFFQNNPTGGMLQSRHYEKSCPKMLVNGIRCATSDKMLENVMKVHDRTVVIAGGVGIASYISLIHALRLQSVMIMADALNNNNGEEVDDDTSIVNNHRRLIYNDGDDDLEGGLEDGHVVNGENVNDIIGNRTTAAAAHNTKLIDVHWMSRDEGLIRHVMENYFEPFCHLDDTGTVLSTTKRKNGHDASCSTCPISINIVVHHTSPHSSLSDALNSSSPSNNNNNNASDSSEPTTSWQPGQQHASMSTGQDINSDSSSFALFPTSTYEGNTKPSPSQNIVPAVTYASIMFGGMWIVNYCYNNIQDRHVIETRPISVIGILVLAILVSVASNAIVLVSNLFYSKLFPYTKLESSGHGAAATAAAAAGVENGNNSGQVPNIIIGQQQLWIDHDENDGALNNMASSSDDKNLEPHTLSPSNNASQASNSHTIMKISHSQGRPNLAAIVQDAMKKVEADSISGGNGHNNGSGGMDVGIFMCGPTPMYSSVWTAVKKEERSGILCKRSTSNTPAVTVYQESFEL
eukprot:CAMPEP_0172311452 /NCGR_PEP_ID=MMETSP1058-20130122/14716_1 /TAXON_ID=83371 /ORGANISM="Detonula confervacea, Strain CCMP 353" /LENGTH=1027 /DNA_ID=CAMNT_0013024621 /DNA_START=265 /DNA_END=3348 /DNA_ORIENTATION=+